MRLTLIVEAHLPTAIAVFHTASGREISVLEAGKALLRSWQYTVHQAGWCKIWGCRGDRASTHGGGRYWERRTVPVKPLCFLLVHLIVRADLGRYSHSKVDFIRPAGGQEGCAGDAISFHDLYGYQKSSLGKQLSPLQLDVIYFWYMWILVFITH